MTLKVHSDYMMISVIHALCGYMLIIIIFGFAGGAVCSLCWSMNGARFAVGSTSGHIEVFGGADRDYSLVTDIKDVQVE